ncbi:MAG: glycosyltransferase 87 family protein [Candidatus Aceula meridiana]|nr:glycosyltransferase 87 family protein [Candidatus Aceula meridiana]
MILAPNTQNLSKSINQKRFFLVVFFSASAALIAKLFFSYNVYGTNDITSWMYFSNINEKYGSFQIYSICPTYNHPPLMSWILGIIKTISLQTQLSFPFVLRLFPIVADYGSIFVIWKILSSVNIKMRTLICILCSINPINFLISGFHGNTDPIFIFLILISIYSIQKEHIFQSGLIFGLSLCVKIVPALLLPMFLLSIDTNRKRTIFILASLLLPFVVFGPYLIIKFNDLCQNIFLYNSLPRLWGIQHILSSIASNQALAPSMQKLFFVILKYHTLLGRLFLAVTILFLSKILTQKKIPLAEGCFLIFSLFLIITPGFGIQYLSWLSYFAVIATPFLGTIYLLIGGIFLYRVYVYWGGGVPPYYANSLKFSQWGNGVNQILDIALWTIIVLMFFWFLLKTFKKSEKIQK